MKKQIRRSPRTLHRAAEVRHQFETHLESLRLKGMPVDEAVDSLASLVARVMESQDASPARSQLVPPPLPPSTGHLLADLRAIPPRMSVTSAAALHWLRHQGLQNPSELSQQLGVSPAAITGTVDSLVRHGWVTRKVDLVDRRKIVLTLTPEGASLAERIFPGI